MKILILAISLSLTASCTDGFAGKVKAFGGKADIKCYSAEKLIFQGVSTGKVSSSSQSDGYYFVDASDGKLKEVSGNCVIQYKRY